MTPAETHRARNQVVPNLQQLLNNRNLLNKFRDQIPNNFPGEYIPDNDHDLKTKIKNNPDWQRCLLRLNERHASTFDIDAQEKVSLDLLLRSENLLDNFCNNARDMFPGLNRIDRRALPIWIKTNSERIHSFS